jgi:hypothetical protein
VTDRSYRERSVVRADEWDASDGGASNRVRDCPAMAGEKSSVGSIVNVAGAIMDEQRRWMEHTERIAIENVDKGDK